MAEFAVIFGVILIFLLALIWWDRKEKGKFGLILYYNNLKIQGEITMAKITRTQQLEGQLDPRDRMGNPAAVEPGTIKFTSSDEEVFVVQQDPVHETKFKIVPKGLGVAQLTYSADADLGEGVATIEGFTAIEVQPAAAVGFGVVLGEPTEIPGASEPEDEQPTGGQTGEQTGEDTGSEDQGSGDTGGQTEEPAGGETGGAAETGTEEGAGSGEGQEAATVDHVVTEEDLVNNPEWVEQGIQVGETIQVPATDADDQKSSEQA